ncbi:MAG TPA: hypothetical protein VEX88_01670 [Glaciibacter sp.]|nr:hypothetical protein [Glaciibacter sp.]
MSRASGQPGRQARDRKTQSAGSDAVLPYTAWLSVFIIPFLVAASVLLYIFPANTEELFAWTIAPPLTAMLLASAYIGGIWFFVQVVVLRRWHRFQYGFAAVVVFATLLGVATFLHWDRFHFGHISFITWATLYVITPFLTFAALLANRRADDSAQEGRDVLIPWPARIVLAAVGILALVCGLVIFIAPNLAIEMWAWEVTPLTARVIGAVLTLPGMVNLWLLRDGRWSSFRWMFQAQLVSLVFISAALLLAWNNIAWSRPSAPLFVSGILASLVLYAVFYGYNERKLRLSRS